ncbi:AAA family ATPase [Bacteroides uniformis]|nr:AAA family ATPase [Bacteroides uniformis]
MWKLKTIEAENLCAFRSLSYTLRQGVTTLIFGDNRDNDSQQSNGAGKSALLECIAVGITGSPLRKIRSEEIINDAAEECRVALHFINDSAAEELLVNRRIPRKGASSVSCTLYRGGRQVMTDEAVQPSVDAYNRYILDKLGVTRDELLNNFILSKYRYEDFLSSSDKEKKEVINRFSNGILVDEAIAQVEEKTSCRSLKRNGRWNWNWPGWTGVSGCYRSRYARRRKPEPSGGVPVWNVSWDWKRP